MPTGNPGKTDQPPGEPTEVPLPDAGREGQAEQPTDHPRPPGRQRARRWRRVLAWVAGAMAVAALLGAVDLALRYVEYNTLLAKVEAVQGPAGAQGVYEGYQAALATVAVCSLDRWEQLPDPARRDAWWQMREAVASTAAELRQLASTVDDQFILPWHRSILATRDRFTEYWDAWLAMLDAELEALSPAHLDENPQEAGLAWADAVLAADPGIRAALCRAYHALDRAMPLLGLFGLRGRLAGVSDPDLPLPDPVCSLPEA